MKNTIRNFINKLLGLSYVRRWNFYPVTRNESVAEHSFYTAMFTILILLCFKKKNGLSISFDVTDYSIIIRALLHDIEEAITGDMPTLVKIYIPNWGKVEEMALQEMTDSKKEESFIQGWIKEIRRVTASADPIVDAADTLSALFYAREQSYASNTFKKIYKEIAAYLRCCVYEEVQDILDALDVPTLKDANYTKNLSHLGE